MPSSLTWLDHDRAARDRSLRILALFREKDSRDELGLGSIRDAFADALFPGTSTIMTRLRYMLFVPWIYDLLEKRQVPALEFGQQARQLEIALVMPLLASEDAGGVFGKNAGGQLQRLPSSVYWSGLRSWGIFRLDRSQGDYHRMVDDLYGWRRRHRKEAGDDLDAEDLAWTWHPRLPPPPAHFPESLDLRLTAEEAEFMLDRLCMSHPDSLLAWLAKHRARSDAAYPWEHPGLEHFPADIRRLLEHGRRFSELMVGAALLYNLTLAEHADRAELVAEHRRAYEQWAEELDLGRLFTWELAELWDLLAGHGHAISRRTRDFVEAWVGSVREARGRGTDSGAARWLVRSREQDLKRARSRFVNRTTLAQWSGHSGLGRFTYRWPTVQSMLNDLVAGLEEA